MITQRHLNGEATKKACMFKGNQHAEDLALFHHESTSNTAQLLCHTLCSTQTVCPQRSASVHLLQAVRLVARKEEALPQQKNDCTACRTFSNKQVLSHGTSIWSKPNDSLGISNRSASNCRYRQLQTQLPKKGLLSSITLSLAFVVICIYSKAIVLQKNLLNPWVTASRCGRTPLLETSEERDRHSPYAVPFNDVHVRRMSCAEPASAEGGYGYHTTFEASSST